MSDTKALPEISPATMREMIGPHPTADIVNLLNGATVRHLSRLGESLAIDPTGGYEVVTMPLDTPLYYTAVPGDRGSIIFDCAGFIPHALLCTEFDTLKYPDGTAFQISAGGIKSRSFIAAA